MWYINCKIIGDSKFNSSYSYTITKAISNFNKHVKIYLFCMEHNIMNLFILCNKLNAINCKILALKTIYFTYLTVEKLTVKSITIYVTFDKINNNKKKIKKLSLFGYIQQFSKITFPVYSILYKMFPDIFF